MAAPEATEETGRAGADVVVVEPCAPQGIEAWARAGFIAWPGAEFDRSRNGLRAGKNPQQSIRPRAGRLCS